MSSNAVDLVAVDEPVLARLLAVAVSDAEPTEVMAPVPGPAGWTPARRDAFRRYHRHARADGCSRPAGEMTFAVAMDGRVVGALRLARVQGDAAALELGLWLGRQARGNGVARAALPAARSIARELQARRLVARTTVSNSAALATLRVGRFGIVCQPDGEVEACLDLE